MKAFKCPICKRVINYNEKLVVKVCPACMVEMEVVEYGQSN